MKINVLSAKYAVSGQISPDDIPAIAKKGYQSILINRPDEESGNRLSHEAIETLAQKHGLKTVYLPVAMGQVTDHQVTAFKNTVSELPTPILAYCRSGTRSATLWALSESEAQHADDVLKATSNAGYNLESLRDRFANQASSQTQSSSGVFDVVVIGGGAAGLSVISSLLKRRKNLKIALIDPATKHHYQPGWTLVGGGVFDQRATEREMHNLIPNNVTWYQQSCIEFLPERHEVQLDDGNSVKYQSLIVAAGLKLDWNSIDGLEDSLGKNGVTSNYCYGLGSYTWQLVQSLKEGRALFTQPAMPIKCAGAPQKAMYLSCDAWKKQRVLSNIAVNFHTAGDVLFGVADYVPALMKYVDDYQANLKFKETLIAVDGENRLATFEIKNADGTVSTKEEPFDMLHVSPPQCAPDFLSASILANDFGWLDVNEFTLQHQQHSNIFGLGDITSTSNAKTAAAIRKQAPVVAHNVVQFLEDKEINAIYNGYGACPLTVSNGRVVLAEFAYKGELNPTFPKWLLDGTKATRLGWYAKTKVMPQLYFDVMLKGHEWLAAPSISTASKI